MKAGKITIDITAGTAQFVVDMEKANAKMREFGSGADATRRKLSDLGSHSVTDVQATSAALRVLEGNMQNNLRAAERFLASYGSVGSLLQTAFPVVGAVALLGVLSELVNKIGEAYSALIKMGQAPQKIADDFQKLNAPLEIANDQLAITNDRLANAIAKLGGKPENSVKLALDEARLAADELTESLGKSLEGLNKLLSDDRVPLWQQFLGQAGTADIRKQFSGDGRTDAYGLDPNSFRGRVLKITDQTEQELQQIQPGTNRAQQEEARRQIDLVRQRERNALEAEYRTQLQYVNTELEKSRQLAAEGAKQPAQRVVSSIGGVPIFNDNKPPIPDQSQRLAQLEGERRFLNRQLTNFRERDINVDLETQKSKLDANAAAEELTAPYRNKMAELNAQFSALRANLASIGQGFSSELLARSFAQATEEITKQNNELSKHHRALTLNQQVEMLSVYDQIASVKAQEELRSKTSESSEAINARVESLRRMSDAIGAGYEAEKQAAVEADVMRAVTPKAYADPEFQRQNRDQLETLRTGFSLQYDAERGAQSAQAADKLQTQAEQERGLAAAQKIGGEAVRSLTVGYKLRELAQSSGLTAIRDAIDAETKLAAAEQRPVNLARIESTIKTPADENLTPQQQAARSQISSTLELSTATESNQQSSRIAQINAEIAATERLTVAQTQGAQAVRQAELANRIEEIERSTPAGQERTEQIGSVTRLARLQEQQEITASAIQSGIAYQNQLESIDRQLATLQTLKATQGDTLAIEISLKTLEQQRAQVYAEQTMQVGTMREGLRALFQEMATQGESAAQQVHDALKEAFEGLNDNLARLLSGQKVNWGSFFQGISADLARMSLRQLEAQIAARFFPPDQQNGPAQPVGGVRGALGRVFGSLAGTPAAGPRANAGGIGNRQPWDERIPAPTATGGILSRAMARDGQSAGTALFVTTVSGPAAANASPSVAAAPVSTSPAQPVPSIVPTGSQANGEQDRGGAPGTLPADVLTRLPSGLIQRSRPNSSGLTPGDLSNLGDFANSELAQLEFGGFFASGGDVNADELHVIGEEGPELFLPDSDGTILSNRELKDRARSLQQIQQYGSAFPDGDSQADLNEVLNQATARANAKGGGFDDTQSHSKISGLSLPTARSGGFGQLAMQLVGAGLSVLGATGIGGGSDGGDSAGGGSVGGDSSSDTPTSGELSQLDNSSDGTQGNLAYDSIANVFSGPDAKDASSTQAGNQSTQNQSTQNQSTLKQFTKIASTLGPYAGLAGSVLGMLFGHKQVDHHFKAGNAYSIPNFNGAFADGGKVEGGKTHLVGEKGPELFIPERDGTIIPNHKLSSFQAIREKHDFRAMAQQGAANGGSTGRAFADFPSRTTMPFGGYRASGGDVDPGMAYMVGEQGPELWTPTSSGGSVVSHSELLNTQSQGGNTYIDARNSDPAAVEQRIRQAMQASHNAAVRNSFKSYQEYTKRTPSKTDR